MSSAVADRLRNCRRQAGTIFRRPDMLAFLPATMLAAFWLGGEVVLLAVALAMPLGLALLRPFGAPFAGEEPADPVTGLPLRPTVVARLDQSLAGPGRGGRGVACLVIGLDEVEEITARFGHAGFAQVMRRTGERLQGALRGADLVVRLEGACFAVALAPMRHGTLDNVLQIALRLQTASQAPIALDSTTVYVSASVGLCLDGRAAGQGGEALLSAAEAAMTEARRHGPSAVRAWSSDLQAALDHRHALVGEIDAALDSGEIRPWFQPQISTDTGAVTGFEALARWTHPIHGVIPPADFIPAVEAAGLSERLGEVILYHALTAIRSWDRHGLGIPCVGVNVSRDELRNPRMAEKLKWEIDRFDLSPDRLTVEVLEDVAADLTNEVAIRNIRALAELGCGIDLDDFGTGHASITNIRRFAVRRLKIDRSFVTRVDTDREQQRYVAAVLSMAEQLGLETVAEGVETAGEHAMLAQLGCGHVQGFGIARPMPFEDTLDWIRDYRQKIAATARLANRTG